MQEISVRDQLKKLVELQHIDSEIFNIQHQLKEKPALVEELKNQFESTKVRLTGLQEKAKQVEVTRKGFETDLKSKEDDIAKANTVLNTLKTNKEYQAKQTEIESIKADMSLIEEDILNSYDETDVFKDEIAEEQKKVVEEEKIFLAKKNEVNEDVKVLEDRAKVCDAQKKDTASSIDKSYLSLYERIQGNKEDGLAIVQLLNNSCLGCNINVTQQQINAAKMSGDLVFCEMCARILYIEDEF